jgi:hypothetical protein
MVSMVSALFDIQQAHQTQNEQACARSSLHAIRRRGCVRRARGAAAKQSASRSTLSIKSHRRAVSHRAVSSKAMPRSVCASCSAKRCHPVRRWNPQSQILSTKAKHEHTAHQPGGEGVGGTCYLVCSSMELLPAPKSSPTARPNTHPEGSRANPPLSIEGGRRISLPQYPAASTRTTSSRLASSKAVTTIAGSQCTLIALTLQPLPLLFGHLMMQASPTRPVFARTTVRTCDHTTKSAACVNAPAWVGRCGAARSMSTMSFWGGRGKGGGGGDECDARHPPAP